ncbi:MAG TPA: aspartate aminotransferase family protein [Gaiellaceae bacterium]
MDTTFWHPFANMARVREHALTIVRGEGAVVWDDTGREYIDATGALWFCNVGHGRAELAEAAARQMRSLASYHTFGVFTNPQAEELAGRIASLAPVEDAKVFLTPGGGSDSIDTAGKLARAFWHVQGRSEKQTIVARSLAYHGVNAYGTSLGGIPANAAAFGRLVADVEQVAWDDAEALANAIERLGADSVAAFICEPVVGAGGVLPPPPGYLERVEDICRANDVLLIADEVITGFGRLGEWFGSDRFGFHPDLVTVAKGLTSGYAPLGAVIAAGHIAEPFWRCGTEEIFRHGYTYSGHAASCAVALANLDVIERERLVERVRGLEPVLETALRPLAAHELVGEVRTIGLLGAVELSGDVLADRPELTDRVAEEALRRGVIVRALRGAALQISPPFVVSEDQLTTLAPTLRESLDAAV